MINRARVRDALLFSAVFLALALSSCATSGRYVLLKEYGASVPARDPRPLEGVTICIKGFDCAPQLNGTAPEGKDPLVPRSFSYLPLTDAQMDKWNDEADKAKDSTPKAALREIGNLRNGYGMILSHIWALNDPGAWLADSLRKDWESLGATVVDPASADQADVVVGGQIQLCKVDMYMGIWSDLIVDLAIQPKGGQEGVSTIYTKGTVDLTWAGSSEDFFTSMRQSRQKFSWLATDKLLAALGRQ